MVSRGKGVGEGGSGDGAHHEGKKGGGGESTVSHTLAQRRARCSQLRKTYGASQNGLGGPGVVNEAEVCQNT